jgi:energy-coupling factor transporter ATP-binding protein EcfA2
MIKRIQIRDFRGIQAGGLDRFRQFNLLIGPNNSGKTTLMEVLYLTGSASQRAGLTVQQPAGPAHYDVLVARPDLLGDHPMTRVWARHNYPGQQSGLGHWSDGVLKIAVRDRQSALSSFDLSTGDRGFTQGEERTTALFSLGPQEHPTEKADPAAVLAAELLEGDTEPFADRRLVFFWHPDLTYYYRGSAAWLVQGRTATAEHVLFYDTAVMAGHLRLDFCQRMLGAIPGWTQQIARRFGRIFGLDRPFNVQFLPVGPEGRWMQGWIAPEDRQAMPIDAFGDGARGAFKLLTPLVALTALAHKDAPGLVLWEEPELFQNPQTLGRLLTEVVDIIRSKPIQIFVASHSLEVVAHLTAMLQDGRLNANDALVYRLDLREGQLHSSWFDADNLVAWLETGLDPRIWGDFRLPLQFRLRQEEA